MKDLMEFGDNTENDALLNTVVIGSLVGFEAGLPLVMYDENPNEVARLARAMCVLGVEDIGNEVALLFENGKVRHPIVLGKIKQQPAVVSEVALDNLPPQPIDLTAQNELTLRCGKASITLTKEGKIILRGTYISSRSSGANRIKGGSVHLN